MKKLLSIVLVAVMVLALGCTAFADGTEITYWSMWNEGEPQATVIAEAAEAYEAETGVHVNIEWKGRDINTLLSTSCCPLLWSPARTSTCSTTTIPASVRSMLPILTT